MIPTKTIEELILNHSTLEKDLSSGDIDKKIFAEKSKEYSSLNEIIENAKSYISYDNDKKDDHVHLTLRTFWFILHIVTCCAIIANAWRHW